MHKRTYLQYNIQATGLFNALMYIMYIYSCVFLLIPYPPCTHTHTHTPTQTLWNMYNIIMHTSSVVMNTLYCCEKNRIKTDFVRILNVLFMNPELHKYYIEYTFTIP